MIKHDNTFNLGCVTSNICMQLTGTNTTAVLGLIKRRATGRRASPPACGNSYDTAYLPFAKGHILGLEIGGTDSPYNVVPQFEDWQGKANGEWRQMEIDLDNALYQDAVVLIELTYNRPGVEENHDIAIAQFQNNQLRDWTDPRIPDSYTIRIFNEPLDPSTILTDLLFNQAVTMLKTKAHVFSKQFNLGTIMPEPDRSMYINQYALDAAYDYHDATKLNREVSMISLILEPGTIETVRTAVGQNPAISQAEATAIQGFPIMFAYQKGLTLSKVVKQRNKRLAEGLPTATEYNIGLRNAGVKKAKKPKVNHLGKLGKKYA